MFLFTTVEVPSMKRNFVKYFLDCIGKITSLVNFCNCVLCRDIQLYWIRKCTACDTTCVMMSVRLPILQHITIENNCNA